MTKTIWRSCCQDCLLRYCTYVESHSFRLLVHLACCSALLTQERMPWTVSWTLVSAKDVFDSNEASGIVSEAMLSAAQEWRHSLLQLTQPAWRKAPSVSSPVMWYCSMADMDPLCLWNLPRHTEHLEDYQNTRHDLLLSVIYFQLIFSAWGLQRERQQSAQEGWGGE